MGHHMSHSSPQTVVITGASSGLGKALALIYAEPKRTIHIFGRDKTGLNDTATRIQHLGAIPVCHFMDVTDKHKMADTLTEIDQNTPIELLIANAGISAGTEGNGESEEQCRSIFGTNLTGVLNTVLPVLPILQNRQSGQIAIVSSMASFRGIPSAPAYCASKAAVRIWGEALRGEVAKDSVKINVICPGFVKTPMTDVNTFPMPFMISPEHAAWIIKRKLAKNIGRISFPWPMSCLCWLLQVLPNSWLDFIGRQLPKKR